MAADLGEQVGHPLRLDARREVPAGDARGLGGDDRPAARRRRPRRLVVARRELHEAARCVRPVRRDRQLLAVEVGRPRPQRRDQRRPHVVAGHQLAQVVVGPLRVAAAPVEVRGEVTDVFGCHLERQQVEAGHRAGGWQAGVAEDVRRHGAAQGTPGGAEQRQQVARSRVADEHDRCGTHRVAHLQGGPGDVPAGVGGPVVVGHVDDDHVLAAGAQHLRQRRPTTPARRAGCAPGR